jgi:hypothetical protein
VRIEGDHATKGSSAMRSFVTTTTAAATAAVAALALSGCGGSPSTDAGSASAAGSASTSATASATASASASPTEAALPAGNERVEAPKSGIRFPVPEDWKEISFREVLDSGDKDAIEEAAKSMGVTPEQLETVADQIEVMAFGPAVKGFAVNINAVPQPNTAMPSAAEATSQMQQIGGKVGKAKEGTTSLGRSLVVPYTLKVQDRTVQGRTLLIETDDGVATLTVSHVSADEADKLAKAILDNVDAL